MLSQEEVLEIISNYDSHKINRSDQFIMESTRLLFHIKLLKIGFDSEKKLVDEYTLESSNVVLFVEHQHCLFVINRIHRAE